MKVVKPSVMVFEPSCDVLQMLELAGRTCYKSHDKITENSAESFVKNVIKNGHEAMGTRFHFCCVCDRQRDFP